MVGRGVSRDSWVHFSFILMSYYLSIDQSTSGTKALLFNEQLGLVDKESVEHKQYYPKPGWVEHDVEEIWQNLKASVCGLLARHTGEVEEIACLSISNQRETVVVFDRETGEPLYPAMVWQCRRGTDICHDLVDGGHGERVEKKTGLKVDAYFSASKLKWLINEKPEIRQRLEDGSALVGTMDAYLVYRMTKGRHFYTDTTNASRTLLFDIETLDWDDELCRLWEVPRGSLPEVKDSSSYFGETSLDGVLPISIPICGVMGDSQAALFAQGCFKPGQGKITFGTGSSLLLNSGGQRRHPGNGVVETLAWTIEGEPTYAFEGIVISSGATLAWLRDQLGLFVDYDEVEALARSVEGNGGVYLVPAFTGLGLPYWKSEARAALVGMSSQCNRGHVVRAGLESIAFQVAAALEAMQAEAGIPLARLRADGGATANRFLMELVADLCGAELQVSVLPECSGLGATMSGLLGLGVVKNADALLDYTREVTSYKGERSFDTLEELKSGWNRAVSQTLADSKNAPLKAVP